VCETFEEAPLADQDPPRPPVVAEIWAQGLGDAAAGALLAPDVIDIEIVAPVEVGNDLVTGCEGFACAQRWRAF
jgi:hypothetical protein